MISKDDLPLIGILRGIAEKDVKPLAEIFVEHRIKHVEVTMNTNNASQLIAMFNEAGGNKLNIGAGTVLDKKDLNEALSAGAKFIVSPSLIEEVIDGCLSKAIPVFPGALTPTEIHTAWTMGATMVKLFPASLFGPGYLKAVKGPFNNIKIIAVGGVGPQNIAKFIENGADAVAFGAGIVRPNWLKQNQYNQIEQHLKSLIDAFNSQSSDQ